MTRLASSPGASGWAAASRSPVRIPEANGPGPTGTAPTATYGWSVRAARCAVTPSAAAASPTTRTLITACALRRTDAR